MTCLTCSDETHRLVLGECLTCYEYRRRTGRERPERLIVSHGRRILERELMRRFRRIA